MEYELYLDVLFLVNFMMDYLILLLTKRILKSHTTYIRILLGAFLGACLTCIVIVLAIPNVILQFLLFHIIVNSVMILTALMIQTIGEYIKGLISLYIASILLGGVFQLFSQYATIGSLFFALAVTSYYLVKGIWFFVEQLGKYNQEFYPVELHIEGRIIKVMALMDTGNGLREPLSYKPVSVVDKGLIEREDIVLHTQHHIPYNTIGDKGVLTAITIEKLHIGGSKNLWVLEPIIAVSKETISSNGSYQMILHPEIF